MDYYLIIVNKDRDEALLVTKQVEQCLNALGKQYRTVFETETEEAFQRALQQSFTCAIVLGGDGTLIRAANRLLHQDIPIFGINTGTLGFLTGMEASEADRGVERLCRGEYRLEKRMMLDVCRNGNYMDSVLNEVVINRSGFSRLVSIAVYVNHSLLDIISGDGLLISTPTGSTGYNLSAGGAIVQPQAELMMITPICPHSLTSRGIIVSAADEISIEIREGKRTQEKEVTVTLDGQEAGSLRAGERITVKRSAYTTKLVKMDERTFFEVLRSKLGTVER